MVNIIISPEDSMIETLRERERQLDTDVQMLTVRRDEVRELITLLISRKPRAPRAPRPAAAPAKTSAAADAGGVAVDREPQVNGVVVTPFAFNAPAPEAA